jgi:signal transduction histidine kinase
MILLQQNPGLIFFALFLGVCFRHIWVMHKFKKALRLNGDVSARFCHAIRTPLTTLCGIAAIFEDEQDRLDSEQKQLVRRLISSTDALKKLIEERAYESECQDV